VVFIFVPTDVAVTLTLNVHDPDAGIVSAELIVPEPATAEMDPEPHDPVKPFGDDTVNPEGSVSVKPRPVSPVPELGLVIVKLRVVEPFTEMPPAPNDWLSAGGE